MNKPDNLYVIENNVFSPIFKVGRIVKNIKLAEEIAKAQANLSTNLTEAEILTVLLPDTNLAQRLNDPEDWVHLLAGLFSYITGL